LGKQAQQVEPLTALLFRGFFFFYLGWIHVEYCLGVGTIYYLEGLPRLHLFDPKYSKNRNIAKFKFRKIFLYFFIIF